MNVDSQITTITEIISDSNEDATLPTATKVEKK